MARVTSTEIQPYLAGVDYPTTKEEIIEKARENGAPDDVIRTLQRLSDDEYKDSTELMSVFGDTVNEEYEEADEANTESDEALGEKDDEDVDDLGYHVETIEPIDEKEFQNGEREED